MRTPLLAAHWFRRSAHAAVGCALLLSHPTEHRLFAAFRGSAVCTPLLAAHCLRRSAHAAVGCVLPLLHPKEHRLFAAFRVSAARTPLLAAHCLRRSAHAAVGCVLPSLHPTEVVISTTKNTSPKEVHLFLSFGITPRGSGCNCAIVDAEHLCSPCN